MGSQHASVFFNVFSLICSPSQTEGAADKALAPRSILYTVILSYKALTYKVNHPIQIKKCLTHHAPSSNAFPLPQIGAVKA